MSEHRHTIAPIFSQVDVTTGAPPQPVLTPIEEHTELLREVLSAQDRTNELLEELIGNMSAAQKQRNSELQQWRQANPRLARSCREAAEALSRVQIEYLDRVTAEIRETCEDMTDGEFVLNEFIDRFGPRLAHLNGVIQVLAQLSAPGAPAANHPQ